MNLLFTIIKLLIPLKNLIFFGYHLPLPFKVVFINRNIGKHFLDCKLFSNLIDYFYAHRLFSLIKSLKSCYFRCPWSFL